MLSLWKRGLVSIVQLWRVEPGRWGSLGGISRPCLKLERPTRSIFSSGSWEHHSLTTLLCCALPYEGDSVEDGQDMNDRKCHSYTNRMMILLPEGRRPAPLALSSHKWPLGGVQDLLISQASRKQPACFLQRKLPPLLYSRPPSQTS